MRDLLVTGGAFFTFVPDRLGHDRRYALSNSRLHQELGWSPAIPFLEGLDLTIRWYLEHRVRWRSLTSTTHTLRRVR